MSNARPDGTKPSAVPQRRPLVLHTAAKGALRVVACSWEAQRCGVRVGMPLAEAESLVGEEIAAVSHEPTADAARLRELALRCRQFSPVCGVEASDPPSCVLLELEGCGHLFGSDRGLAEAAVRTIGQEFGYRVQAGIGPTIGTAWAAANAARNGVCELRTDNAVRWLDRQPVAALRLPAEVVDGLAEFDLRTVRQVRDLPRDALPSRFGPALLQRLDQADGRLPEAIAPLLPDELLTRHWTTEHPLRQSHLASFILEDLVGKLMRALPDGIGLTELQTRIASTEQTVELMTRLAQPSRSERRVFDLLELRLERTRLPRSIDRISITASGVQSLREMQTDLFGNPLQGEHGAARAALVERLVERLGADRVCRVRPTYDPIPERAFTFEPAIGDVVAGQSAHDDGSESGGVLAGFESRPTLLLDRPIALGVWSVGRRPQRLEYRGCRYAIRHAWGPERIESGWWREEGEQRRDYYRIELLDGPCLWIFRQQGTEDWFLHGAF